MLELLKGRKEINKNVNLVEKSCPRLAVGRDKTGLAEPWLTVEERLGDRQSGSQGRAEGTCLPQCASSLSSLSTPTAMCSLNSFRDRRRGGKLKNIDHQVYCL